MIFILTYGDFDFDNIVDLIYGFILESYLHKAINIFTSFAQLRDSAICEAVSSCCAASIKFPSVFPMLIYICISGGAAAKRIKIRLRGISDMMRIAVCDDDAVTRAYLIALIEKQNIDCEIAEFDSAQGYLADGRGFDIIFLDIEMSEGKGTGVELARKIRANMRNQPIIIFVTGYDKYVYDAFDVEAFQYLLKPVEEQKFAQVLQRAVKKIIAEKNAGETLMIRYANSKKAIPTGSIYYIESRNHKVILHLNDGELEYYAKIGELERQLQRSFFRIHKGYLINMFYIDSYTKTDVLLTSGDRLLISKYKYSDFVKAYLRFLKRGLADE